MGLVGGARREDERQRREGELPRALAVRDRAILELLYGSGLRRQPSNEGGIRQTPPRPDRLLARCSFVYSTRP